MKIFHGGNSLAAPLLEYFKIVLVELGGGVLSDPKGEIFHACDKEFNT